MRRAARFLKGLLPTREPWDRVVLRRETTAMIEQLAPQKLKVLEISGDEWSGRLPFRSYRSANYPAYDVCAGPLDETFDLIIAEQVFEHLPWPYRAGRHIHRMLDPGGYFLNTTPFLVRVHEFPIDCSRWTETGMKHLLAECGFDMQRIRTGSWGNRACVEANFRHWQRYRPSRHSLKNEPKFPVVVWALAQK